MSGMCKKHYLYGIRDTNWFLTIWDAVIEAISDTVGVLPVFSFKLVFAGLPITARQNVRDKFIVLAELGESLQIVR
jgi:hypothetical protein